MAGKEECWEKNLEHLMSGGFGDTTRAETLLNYWYAQESAGYPYASENVKYLEEMVGIERKPLDFEKRYDSTEITNEMRKLADEMGKAISTAYEERYLADERRLEEVLKANGWCKTSEVVTKLIEDVATLIESNWNDIQHGSYWLTNGRCIPLRELLKTVEKKYTEGGNEI